MSYVFLEVTQFRACRHILDRQWPSELSGDQTTICIITTDRDIVELKDGFG